MGLVSYFYNDQKAVSEVLDNKVFSYLVFNNLFEREYVGYRFVNGQLVKITDKAELETIEKACHNKFDGCRSHIQKALNFLRIEKIKIIKMQLKKA